MSRKQRRILQGTTRGRRGFSIVELLIALIIIGVLTAVLVPAISHRAEESRHSACIADLTVIADAEDRVATDTGYYVRLYALSDLPRGDGIGRDQGGDALLGLADECPNINPNPAGAPGALVFGHYHYSIFIRPATNSSNPAQSGPSVLTDDQAKPVFQNILGVDLPAATGAADYAYASNWQGPYYTIKRDETVPNPNIWPFPATPPLDPIHLYATHLRGIPNDPWGNDYVLYFRNGMVNEPSGDPANPGTPIYPGPATATGFAFVNLYDRPTVVSAGPDGVLGTADDLTCSFGY